MRYGDRSIDVPCITGTGVKNPEAMAVDAETAIAWCKEYVEKNEAPFRVKLKWNAHDFGSYPTVEIYYDLPRPHEFDDACSDGECDECVPYGKMLEKVDAFEEAYSEKFKQWL